VTDLTDEHLAKLVSRVTETMTGISFTVSPSREIDSALLAHAAVLTIGEDVLTVGLASDENGSARLGSMLFSCAPAQVDASMRNDSMSELVNMTAGQIKVALLLDVALGLPKVVGAGAPRPDGPGWRKVRLRATGVELVVLLSELNTKVERRK
jgi:hypothetical protein